MRSSEKTTRQGGPADIGTLWSMRRRDHAARCALLTGNGEWIIRVLIDGGLLLEDRSADANETFSVAEQWRLAMIGQGWNQVLPGGYRSDDHHQRAARPGS